MARLIVIAPGESAAGYRLAGVTVLEAGTAAVAERLLNRLIDDGETGVVALPDAYLGGFGHQTNRRLDDLIIPVVVGLPAADRGEAPGTRRARLTALLQRAIGYRITFRGEDA